MFMRMAFLVLLLYNFSFCVSAQRKMVSISGVVIEKENKKPVEFATLQVLQLATSVLVKNTITNKIGKFSLDSIEVGTYLFRYSHISLGVTEIELNIAAMPSIINLGNIEMAPLALQLSNATVTAQRGMLKAAIDKKVYNVGQDIMATSGSVSDVLKNVPSVEIDIEGNVALRGSGDVLILINGRPSPLMGKNRAEALQQIPANAIERVEVITNPSARFRPDGTSGIINIVMKKNIKAGITGILIGNVGNRQRSNGSLNINFKKGTFNSFFTYSIRQDERNRFNDIRRENLDSFGKIAGYYNEQGRLKARPLSHLFRAGAEYTLDDNNSIGINGGYLPSALTRNDRVSRSFYNNSYQLTNLQDRTRNAPATEAEKDATIYWQHNFKKEGEELRIEANAASQSEDEKNYYANNYNFPPKRSILDNNWVNQIEKNQQITADYVNPVSEKIKVELGYAGSFRQQDIDFYVEDFDTLQNKFVKNTNRSNRFLYNETVHAFYSTYLRSFEAFSISVGLRGEAAYTRVNLLTKDSIIGNNYYQLYPTLHLAYELPKGEVQLNYSRRVNRPDGDDMNPFPEYIDPLNLRAGNPKLLPEFIHSVELGYQIKSKVFTFVPSIYYRYKYNAFTQVTKRLNDSVLLTTRDNLSNDQSAGVELIVSASPYKFFSANLSTNIFYNTINAADLGFAAKKSIVSTSTNFNSTFTFAPNTLLQISCNYRSARQTAQGLYYPTFVINMGARQDFFKKKLALTLTLSDVFKTLQQKVILNTDFLNQTAITNRDARVFYIGLSYKFGNSTTTKKPAEEKMQFDNNL